MSKGPKTFAVFLNPAEPAILIHSTCWAVARARLLVPAGYLETATILNKKKHHANTFATKKGARGARGRLFERNVSFMQRRPATPIRRTDPVP